MKFTTTILLSITLAIPTNVGLPSEGFQNDIEAQPQGSMVMSTPLQSTVESLGLNSVVQDGGDVELATATTTLTPSSLETGPRRILIQSATITLGENDEWYAQTTDILGHTHIKVGTGVCPHISIVEAQQRLQDAGIQCDAVGDSLVCERIGDIEQAESNSLDGSDDLTEVSVTTSAQPTETPGRLRRFFSNKWTQLICASLATFNIGYSVGSP